MEESGGRGGGQGARRKGKKIKKRNLPEAHSWPPRNPGLGKRPAQEGEQPLHSPRWQQLSHRRLDLPRREKAGDSPLSRVGTGKLGIWPGIWDPQDGRAHPHAPPGPTLT